MARVLVIEDDADLRQVLQFSLTRAGHQAFTAATGSAGLRLAQAVRPDVVLLDLMLPDVSGTLIAKALRREPLTHRASIIIVTGQSEEIDRIVGFELGADDYVLKPFSVRELMLRIDAVLRRWKAPSDDAILVADLRIDREAHRVTVGRREISLTPLEFKILVMLTERCERVLARSALLGELCAVDSEVPSRTIDTHVKHLREKLGTAGRFIETIRGVGYRFTETPSIQADA
jgi:two-component system phosphate regulon response regulator PhoB